MSSYLQLAKTGLYIAANIASGVGIIFANKAVFSLYQFHFIYVLTFTHAVATAGGMMLFSWIGLFQHKRLPMLQVLPLAVAFVGYIVGWNLCLRVNPVGFYQLSKIMITPAVVVIEIFVSNKFPSRGEQAAIGVLCTGVALATVTDPSISTGLAGLVTGIMAVGFTAIYQVWAGSKQAQLQASSMQLMHQYAPLAAALLILLVPIFEPLGLSEHPPGPDTLLGYSFTLPAVILIATTALLGLVVSLSTFLVIGATSSVTFNVTGGVILFQEPMPVQRLLGVIMAMAGILMYSLFRLMTKREVTSMVPSTSQTEPLSFEQARQCVPFW